MAQLDRPVPANVEAEEAVLGSVLVDERALYKAASFIAPEHFFVTKHRQVFAVYLDLLAQRIKIDVVTVCAELDRRGQLQEVGGDAFVVGLLNATPTAIHVAHYARLVLDAYQHRELLQASAQIAQLAYERAPDALNQAQAAVLAVGQARDTAAVSAADLMLSYIERQNRTPEERAADYIPTGYQDLDRLLGGGLERGDLTLVAARPSVGKTALGTCLALHAAVKETRPVLFFSLEMGDAQIGDRLVAVEARVDSQRVRRCELSESEQRAVDFAVGRIGSAPLVVDASPGLSVVELQNRARAWHSQTHGGLVLVDYLQLMRGVVYTKNRVQEIGEISRGLKALAKELQVPVVAMSQLSRANERRDSKRPVLSDLRDSGELEQNADVVLFLHREGRYDEQIDPGETELHVAKQRNGPLGTIGLVFLDYCTRFESRYAGPPL